jgi:hypothetical protein
VNTSSDWVAGGGLDPYLPFSRLRARAYTQVMRDTPSMRHPPPLHHTWFGFRAELVRTTQQIALSRAWAVPALHPESPAGSRTITISMDSHGTTGHAVMVQSNPHVKNPIEGSQVGCRWLV